MSSARFIFVLAVVALSASAASLKLIHMPCAHYYDIEEEGVDFFGTSYKSTGYLIVDSDYYLRTLSSADSLHFHAESSRPGIDGKHVAMIDVDETGDSRFNIRCSMSAKPNEEAWRLFPQSVFSLDYKSAAKPQEKVNGVLCNVYESSLDGKVVKAYLRASDHVAWKISIGNWSRTAKHYIGSRVANATSIIRFDSDYCLDRFAWDMYQTVPSSAFNCKGTIPHRKDGGTGSNDYWVFIVILLLGAIIIALAFGVPAIQKHRQDKRFGPDEETTGFVGLGASNEYGSNDDND